MKRNILILLTLAGSCVNAQNAMPSVINAAGGSYKNGNVAYEWSIGELALINEMHSAEEKIILTNGFLQAYPDHGKKDSTTKPFNGKEVIILPNPTKGKLQVNFSFNEVGRLKLVMYNEFGFNVYKKELYSSGSPMSEIITMDGFANGNYFLAVELTRNYVTTKKKQVFKVIKIH